MNFIIRTTRVLFLATLIGVTFTFGACDKTPSQPDVQNLLQVGLEEIFGEGSLEFQEFNILDSRESAPNTYIYEIDYVLMFLKSSEEIMDEFVRIKEETPKQGLEGFADGVETMVLAMSLGSFESGHQISKKQTTTVQKWDKGWRIIDDE